MEPPARRIRRRGEGMKEIRGGGSRRRGERAEAEVGGVADGDGAADGLGEGEAQAEARGDGRAMIEAE
jgi:hypothetical protein